jgi:hypothetical protein
MATRTPLEHRLGKAGFLIVTGLIVEIAASSLIHPLAFVAFLLVACPLIMAGMLLFLWALVASA